jgi:hypothetical protein
MTQDAETPADDNDRTIRLLNHFDTSVGTHDTPFTAVLLEGLATDKASPDYPPAGHGYPRSTP